MVEWNKMCHGEYQKNRRTSRAYSRILMAQVVWRKTRSNKAAVQIANVHMHHKAAKKDTWQKKNKKWF